MILDYKTILELLDKSGLPDQGSPPRSALLIRFSRLETVARKEEFVTPDGTIVALDVDKEGDLCAMEIIRL